MKSKQFSIRMFIFGIAALIICVVIAYLLKPKYPVYIIDRGRIDVVTNYK